MWNFMPQSGPATTVLDFTNDLSVLLVGLASIFGLSAAMIVWVAIRHYLSQKHERVVKMPSRDTDRRDAA